jgi:nucleolar protein 58
MVSGGEKCINELMRGIKSHFAQFGAMSRGMSDEVQDQARLGLSHKLGRHVVKFSKDKVDTMVIQAICLLDELDKELNTYSMRIREWYGWHFPEMTKIIAEQGQYAQTVLKMGRRDNCIATDLSDVLDEVTEANLKEASKRSMGTQISDEDIENIQALCKQIIDITKYRASLFEYLQQRMSSIAPNLTELIGALVGSRLVAHRGGLISLAKAPASTVQILGAEKALFRALKTKNATPKYGMIFNSSLVGRTTPRNRGKIARLTATKASICVREDALGDSEGVTVAVECLEKLEQRMRTLDQADYTSNTAKSAAHTDTKYTAPSDVKSYSSANDTVAMDVDSESSDDSAKKAKKAKKGKKRKAMDTPAVEQEEPKKSKKDKKKKTKKKKSKKQDSDSD